MKGFFVIPLVASLGLANVACGDGDGPRSATALSRAEIESLLFTREEEKLARDVYRELEDVGAVFGNIAGSEQQHMDAVKGRLDAHGLADPAAGRAPGEFQNETLAGLFGTLTARAGASTLAAHQVGATIEELDIRDLRAARPQVTHVDIANVYDNLERGSRNHLRSFHGQVQALGGSFTPEYLSQEEYDAIVATPVEHGSGPQF